MYDPPQCEKSEGNFHPGWKRLSRDRCLYGLSERIKLSRERVVHSFLFPQRTFQIVLLTVADRRKSTPVFHSANIGNADKRNKPG